MAYRTTLLISQPFIQPSPPLPPLILSVFSGFLLHSPRCCRRRGVEPFHIQPPSPLFIQPPPPPTIHSAPPFPHAAAGTFYHETTAFLTLVIRDDHDRPGPTRGLGPAVSFLTWPQPARVQPGARPCPCLLYSAMCDPAPPSTMTLP